MRGERRGPADVTNVTRGRFGGEMAPELSADTCPVLLDSHDHLDFFLQTLHLSDISGLCHPVATPAPVFLSGIALYPRSSVPFLHIFLRDVTDWCGFEHLQTWVMSVVGLESE